MEKAYVMKHFFRDLDTETKVDIIMNNQKLKDVVWNVCYEQSMENQLENGELMLGKGNNGIEIRDNYSSFYLILRDWHKFLDNLDSDYLCQDGLDLYNKIVELKEEYENEDSYSDRFEELNEEIEKLCKELLKICEKQLHDYENIDDNDVKEYLIFELEGNGLYDDYYIIEDDTSKVYNDVSYTETFE